MSQDLVQDRLVLRASHADRDHAVELLRIAAGDGRLDAAELDERLETALTARTCGELDLLLRDLPLAPGMPTDAAVSASAPAKDLVRLRAHHGNLERVGPWTVPRRLDVEARGGNAVLDFTQAVVTGPVLDLTVAVRGGNLTLVVPPEVAVEIDSVEVRSGNVRQRTRPVPGAPIRLLVTVSGTVRSGNVTVRGPRRTFREWRRGRNGSL
jgi:hypothetical protein